MYNLFSYLSFMNKVFLPWIGVAILAIIGFFVIFPSSPSSSSGSTTESANVVVKNGTQYVTVDVKGGYSPKISTIQAWLPTKLVMRTNGTYDCSSSLVIRSLNYRNSLPASGEIEIDLGTPESGKKIAWTCGMGMYSFSINTL